MVHLVLSGTVPVGNHSSCIHYLGLDICFDEYNHHDSLQACLRGNWPCSAIYKILLLTYVTNVEQQAINKCQILNLKEKCKHKVK